MYKEYEQKCKDGKIAIGQLHLYKGSPRYWILNFPTKDRWRNKSKLEFIEKGLMEFKEKYAEWGITSIAFPRLGCQLGGLNWNEVKPMMEKYLAELPELEVEIFSHSAIAQKPSRKASPPRKLRKGAFNPKQQSLVRYNNPNKSENKQ